MERLIDHYPRYAPTHIENHGWRDKSNPQPGDWEHICTSGECPIGKGNYYVTAMDGPSFYYMAGPYQTHGEALAMVDTARDLADKHDRSGKAWFMSWGTVRTEHTKPGSLNHAGLLPKQID